MRLRHVVPAVLVAATAASVSAHDLFLTLGSFFVQPQSTARVGVMNGTFTTSDGAVRRERLRDLSVASGGSRRELDRTLWDTVDSKLSAVYLPVSRAGTYVLGASLLSRDLTLQASDFNAYLEEEGILPILERRRQRGETSAPARERYAKHVKAILQAGDARTSDYATVFGYPAELVPLENPYSVRAGGTLRVRALVEGAPAPGQIVLYGGRSRSGARIAPRRATANSEGIAAVRLSQAGRWYVKFIHMEPVASDSLDYESKWATLTFEIR